MLEDYWAHRFYDDPKAADEIEDDEFDLEQVLRDMENNPDEWVEVARYDRHQDSS